VSEGEPQWIAQLEAATASWICDAVAILWSWLTPAAHHAHMLYVAMRSDAEHELDYYTRPPRWTLDDWFTQINELWRGR
jgi:hypothetical protein